LPIEHPVLDTEPALFNVCFLIRRVPHYRYLTIYAFGATVKRRPPAGGGVDAYDTVIVGAGPAGGRAGMEIAKDGLSVLFLEKRDVVGVPVQCGEGLSEHGLQQAELPAKEEWIREKVQGVRCVLPDGTDFTVSIPGYCIDRALFDQWIVQQAGALFQHVLDVR